MARIAIVGAGSAGLAAANTLLEAGHEVHIYEASEAIGGRVVTEQWDLGNGNLFYFEKGAQYIQDSFVNPWTAIALNQDFALVDENDMNSIVRTNESGPWQEFPVAFGPDGEPPDGVAALPNLNAAFTYAYAINTSAENLHQLNQPVIAPPPTPLDPEHQLGAALSFYSPLSESMEPWRYLLSDLERQVVPPDPPGGGPNRFVSAGLQNLLIAFGDHLQTQYAGQLFFHFAREVLAITPGDGGLGLQAKVLNGPGEENEAFRYCIVTASVNVIQNIEFNPPLNAEVTIPLQYLRLGSYKKIALHVQQLPPAILENTQYTLNTPVADVAGGNVVWQYWRWQLQPAILMVTVTGSQAAELDALENAAVVTMAVNALSNAYLQEGVQQGDWTVLRSGVTNWSDATFVQGAFSCTLPATNLGADNPTAFNARPTLQDTVQGTCVLFAGEATDTNAYGTLSGSFAQGVAAARRIIEADNGPIV